jgi:hypothetical protein
MANLRQPRRIPRPLKLALALTLATLPLAAAPPICDGSSTLTPYGMDTASGKMLFAVVAGGQAWLVELEGGAAAAKAWPDRGGHFGGSFGPGAILALESCGSTCVHAVAWDAGTWRPRGEALQIPEGSTAAISYDESGAPWIVAVAASGQDETRRAWGFRLEQQEWRAHGALEVSAIGQPQALPSPGNKDSVVCGSGRFSASAAPTTWVLGLPSLPRERRGQILQLPGGGAAYLSADGVVYLSPDTGKSWRRSTWTPWGSEEAVGIWQQGHDFTVDVPLGDHRDALAMAWFDRRNPQEERLELTRLDGQGHWSLLGESPAEVRSKSGERLPVTQVLVPRPGIAVLLSGCVATAQGSGLVLRNLQAGKLSDPLLVPVAVAP